ncbi:MAG: hypothetical protein ACOC9I_02630, partial [Actinomycetota bacterium]
MSTTITSTSPTEEGRRDRRRLGEILVDAGVLEARQLHTALEANEGTERLGSTLQRLGFATDVEIADAVATQLRLPTVDLLSDPPSPE